MGEVLHLIRSILEAGVIDGGGWQPTRTGVPQGGIASPLMVEHLPHAV